MNRRLNKEEILEAAKKAKAEEFLQWRDHPVTQRLFKYLKEWREGLKEDWATGNAVMPDVFQYALQNTLAHAECEVIRVLLELEVTDLGETDE
jgi:hypothetical protein